MLPIEVLLLIAEQSISSFVGIRSIIREIRDYTNEHMDSYKKMFTMYTKEIINGEEVIVAKLPCGFHGRIETIFGSMRYYDGLRHGAQIRKSSAHNTEVIYDHGVQTSWRRTYADGKIIRRKQYNGQMITTDESGDIVKKIDMVNGKKHGMYWAKTEMLEYSHTYVNNVKMGPSRYQTDTMSYIGYCIGEFRLYEFNQLATVHPHRIEYTNRNGVVRCWLNDELFGQVSYRDGKLHGTSVMYHPYKVTYFINGMMVSPEDMESLAVASYTMQDGQRYERCYVHKPSRLNIKELYERDELVSQTYYGDNRITTMCNGVRTCHLNGKIKSITSDRRHQEWDPDGIIVNDYTHNLPLRDPVISRSSMPKPYLTLFNII
jgi:antitoxin component YwqK of YwqJK toxin-antitoxin module